MIISVVIFRVNCFNFPYNYSIIRLKNRSLNVSAILRKFFLLLGSDIQELMFKTSLLQNCQWSTTLTSHTIISNSLFNAWSVSKKNGHLWSEFLRFSSEVLKDSILIINQFLERKYFCRNTYFHRQVIKFLIDVQGTKFSQHHISHDIPVHIRYFYASGFFKLK